MRSWPHHLAPSAPRQDVAKETKTPGRSVIASIVDVASTFAGAVKRRLSIAGGPE